MKITNVYGSMNHDFFVQKISTKKIVLKEEESVPFLVQCLEVLRFDASKLAYN